MITQFQFESELTCPSDHKAEASSSSGNKPSDDQKSIFIYYIVHIPLSLILITNYYKPSPPIVCKTKHNNDQTAL